MVSGTDAGAPQLDLLPTEDVVAVLLRAEERVVPAVRAAAGAIAAAAERVADRLRTDGRLVFVGAGTSGRLAVTEAAELPGTFGLARDRVVGVLAGGGPNCLAGTDDDEDDTDAGPRELAALGVGSGDALIAVAASGRTPYTVAAARYASGLGALVIAVVNTPGSPLAALADTAIEVPVGEEALRGSTRLSAGTAQKLALNALSTAALTRAGRVHGNVMVDVVPANSKLRARAAGIVSGIAGVDADQAGQALEACNWNTRAAVVHLRGGLDPAAAAAHAARHESLRQALDHLDRHPRNAADQA